MATTERDHERDEQSIRSERYCSASPKRVRGKTSESARESSEAAAAIACAIASESLPVVTVAEAARKIHYNEYREL
jgi:hypothetical protein